MTSKSLGYLKSGELLTHEDFPVWQIYSGVASNEGINSIPTARFSGEPANQIIRIV